MGKSQATVDAPAAAPCCGSMLQSPLNEQDAISHAAAFAALADPARLRLLSLIATAHRRAKCACAISSSRSASRSQRCRII